MKFFTKMIFAFLVVFTACKTEKKENKKVSEPTQKTFASFGEKIDGNNVISTEEMEKKYKNLKAGDTITVKFKSKVAEVCQKKGCWMKLDLGSGKQTMVRFKDYGFFMPKNSKGSEAIVNGKAFVTTISVDELKHYAKDAGKTPEEIAKITEPKKTLAFEADGVLMEVKNEK